MYKATIAAMRVTFVAFQNVETRGAESWWGCSDSDSGSDSGLLIDSHSGSGSNTKYKINNTLIVEREKERWHFLLILTFIPSDGRS